MSNPDREWQLKITSLIAEIKTNQDNLKSSLDNYHKTSQDRLDKLEKTIYGNGKAGLAEEVRNIKGKWSIFYGLFVIVVSAAVNGFFYAIFK